MDEMILFWAVLFPAWWLIGGFATVRRVREAITCWQTTVFILVTWPALWAYVIFGALWDMAKDL